jgi:hypothetical protein
MAATPPAAHKAIIALATPTDRHSGIANVIGLLDISFLFPHCFFDSPETNKYGRQFG